MLLALWWILVTGSYLLQYYNLGDLHDSFGLCEDLYHLFMIENGKICNKQNSVFSWEITFVNVFYKPCNIGIKQWRRRMALLIWTLQKRLIMYPTIGYRKKTSGRRCKTESLALIRISWRLYKIEFSKEGSSWSYVSNGIPQGFLLGPVLFASIINNLIRQIDNIRQRCEYISRRCNDRKHSVL